MKATAGVGLWRRGSTLQWIIRGWRGAARYRCTAAWELLPMSPYICVCLAKPEKVSGAKGLKQAGGPFVP